MALKYILLFLLILGFALFAILYYLSLGITSIYATILTGFFPLQILILNIILWAGNKFLIKKNNLLLIFISVFLNIPFALFRYDSFKSLSVKEFSFYLIPLYFFIGGVLFFQLRTFKVPYKISSKLLTFSSLIILFIISFSVLLGFYSSASLGSIKSLLGAETSNLSYQVVSDNYMSLLFLYLVFIDRFAESFFCKKYIYNIVFFGFCICILIDGLASYSSASLLSGICILFLSIAKKILTIFNISFTKLLKSKSLFIATISASLSPFFIVSILKNFFDINSRFDDVFSVLMISLYSRLDVYTCIVSGNPIFSPDQFNSSCNGIYLHNIYSAIFEYGIFGVIVTSLVVFSFLIILRQETNAYILICVYVFLLKSLFSKHWDWSGNFLILGFATSLLLDDSKNKVGKQLFKHLPC